MKFLLKLKRHFTNAFFLPIKPLGTFITVLHFMIRLGHAWND